MTTAVAPIPGPWPKPIVGNIFDLDPNNGIKSMQQLQSIHGEIFKLHLLNRRIICVSSHRLAQEVCDEKRFEKRPGNALKEIRAGVHDGLFTAYNHEKNWGIAHRVLMPAFGPLPIKNMFDEMHDVASQLVLKWARHGPQAKIFLTDDFTRLALDTISLCSMGFRFNSFYDSHLHPFINAMGDFLKESGRRGQRLPLPEWFYRSANQKFADDIAIMRDTAMAVLNERVADPDNERKDLLSAMLKGRDALTGEKMTDESVVDNLITFLIAGHETTSGMLSYAVHQLLKNPEEYRKVQQEVDEVVGTGPVTVQHMSKLPYITAVLRETLRLDSPIPVFGVAPMEDTVIGGEYEIKKEDNIAIILSRLHTDPEIYEDPLKFKPERMLDENFNKLPKNAWMPFGNGARACIGRAFAWQEAILIMAMIFQNFDLSLDDPDYVLDHKATLTLKPDELYIHAKLRPGLDPTKLEDRISRTGSAGKEAKPTTKHQSSSRRSSQEVHHGPEAKMTILYGSNSGTCESMAQSLASNAPAQGFKVVNLSPMDNAVQDLPANDPDHAVIIITASYEGQPPDNAAKFVKWIEDTKEGHSSFKNLSYAVFGCGNHEWAQTFHRIPKLVDARLEELGGKRIAEAGLADAAGDDMFTTFETWEDEVLWPALSSLHGTSGSSSASAPKAQSQSLKVHVSEDGTVPARKGVQETKVISTRILTADGEPAKKHIEIELPKGMTYRAGDYLAIMPSNPKASVLRAMRRFQLPWDHIISLEGSSITLPTNVAMYARTIFSDFVELGQPITKKGILQLVDSAEDQSDAAALSKLTQDDVYQAEVSAKRVSILDLLERYPSVKLDLGVFLALLPPMRVRQYSISSSPLANPSTVTITYSVLADKAKSGQGTYYGVASSYLATLQADDPVHVAVRTSNVHFHLPEEPEAKPIVMIAAGTGMAPFRGFIQERAQLAATKKLAPAYLYYGCRQAHKDDLYSDELAEWERIGAVTVRRAFSRAPDGQKKYVQDVLLEHQDELRDLWKSDAKIFVCGSRAISQAVDQVALQIKRKAALEKGEEFDEEEAKKWWAELRNVRYVADVFD